MKSFLADLKDKSMSGLGKYLLTKSGFDKYGEIQTLDIQSKKKRIDATLLLRGESCPIEIGINYRIEMMGDQKYLIAEQVSFSREWISLFFNDHWPSDAKRIEINTVIAAML